MSPSVLVLVALYGALAQPDARAQPVSPRECAPGAPERTYALSAIHVFAPLNRFGDNDPRAYMYAVDQHIPAVRAQEARRRADRVSTGLGDDAIQPLVVRARAGECLVVRFTNRLNDGDATLPNPAFAAAPSRAVRPGATVTMRIPVPAAPDAEGAWTFADARPDRVAHGLFGAVVVEPPGAVWRDADTGATGDGTGWEAMIELSDAADFREFVLFHHRVGDESATGVQDAAGNPLPTVDDLAGVRFPGGWALNYRSEPLLRRLALAPEATTPYGSYTFGDPATPIPRSYLGDPARIRKVYVGDTADGASASLPAPERVEGASVRVPPPGGGWTDGKPARGVAATEVPPCGAGGCAGTPGDFPLDAGPAERAAAGMWSFWRVFDTRQAGLAALPDREAPPAAVPSTALIGSSFRGRVLLPAAWVKDPDTQQSVESWVEAQLPPAGKRLDALDASVWDWTRVTTPKGPLYLGEPETEARWPNYTPTSPGKRQELRFDPVTGRVAWPLLRPHLGQRAPFAGQGHTGAPSRDGACPAPDPTAPVAVRHLPLSAVPIAGSILWSFNEHVDALRAGMQPPGPLAIHAERGQCVRTLLTNASADPDALPAVTLDLPGLAADPQGSGGAGLSFEQAARPYAEEARTLGTAALSGATTVHVTSVDRLRPGVWIGVGLGEGTCDGLPCTEIRRVTGIVGNNVTLDQPLWHHHRAGEHVGVEFVQGDWYVGAEPGTRPFHDRANPRGEARGLVGVLVVERPGAGPATGAASIGTVPAEPVGAEDPPEELIFSQGAAPRTLGPAAALPASAPVPDALVAAEPATGARASGLCTVDLSTSWTRGEALAAVIDTLPATGEPAVTAAAVTLVADEPLEIFRLPATAFASRRRLLVDAPEGTTVVVSLTGPVARLHGLVMVLEGGVTPATVLLHLPSATHLSLPGALVRGTVLAPLATADLAHADVRGAVRVRAVGVDAARLSPEPFVGGLPCGPVAGHHDPDGAVPGAVAPATTP